MLRLLFSRLDLADDDELSRFARLYGGTIQRLVGSGLQFFDLAVRQKVAAFELPNEEKDAMVYQRAAGYTELRSAARSPALSPPSPSPRQVLGR